MQTMDILFWLLVTVLTTGNDGAISYHGTGRRRQSLEEHKKHIPTCPVGETCTIDRNCQAPDGTSFCEKDIRIKECPNGQSVCTLFDGSTGCSTCCDGVPECFDQSDETRCNRYKCKATWRMVYEHDASGNPVSGNKSDLREAVRRGAEVKVFRGDSNVDTPETTLIIGDEVCGQSIFHMSRSWSTIHSEAYWWFSVACSTGDLAMARWYVGSRAKPNDNQDTSALMWFIREVEDQPLLTVPTAGRMVNALTHAVKKSGYGVTVKQKSSFLKEEYHTADNLEISTDGTSIVAQKVWNLLNEDFSTVVKVSKNGNWLFKNFASDGSVELSKYLVGENTRVAKDSAGRNPSDWYLDPCWQLVYANSASGSSIEGSKETLINAVMAGHRVKVMVKNRISRATTVLINKGVVTAFVPNMLKKSNISTLEDPATAAAKWEWMLVNTNGKSETALYLVGEASGSVSSSNVDIKWFVDRRDWNKVLDVDPKNVVNSGSKAHIADEIRNGADIRYAWVSSEAVYTFMEADNIGFDETKPDFGAQHLRSVMLSSVGNEYKFDTSFGSLTWYFTITTNSGAVASSKWQVGGHVSRGGNTTSRRVIWFIAK